MKEGGFVFGGLFSSCHRAHTHTNTHTQLGKIENSISEPKAGGGLFSKGCFLFGRPGLMNRLFNDLKIWGHSVLGVLEQKGVVGRHFGRQIGSKSAKKTLTELLNETIWALLLNPGQKNGNKPETLLAEERFRGRTERERERDVSSSLVFAGIN